MVAFDVIRYMHKVNIFVCTRNCISWFCAQLLKKCTLLIGFKLNHCFLFVHPLNIMIRSWIEFSFCVSLLNSQKLIVHGTQKPITRSWIVHRFSKADFDWIQAHTRFDVVSTTKQFWIVNPLSNLAVIDFLNCHWKTKYNRYVLRKI